MAAHKFEVQALVALRGKKILAICFLGSEDFAQRFNWPFDEKIRAVFLASHVTFLAKFWGHRGTLGGFFGSNVPLALLIDP